MPDPRLAPLDPLSTANSSRFVRACLRQPVDRTPVWFLRQAGRYMPEYMAVRKHHSLLEICRNPDIAAEVTITAAERLGVDAAIIFADLLLPFTPMGLDFEFVAGEGPQVNTPIRGYDQVAALRTDRIAELGYVARAIEKVATYFASKARTVTPLPNQDELGIIGFCGAPFTLASYMIEGGSSRNYIDTKKLMYASGSVPDATGASAFGGSSSPMGVGFNPLGPGGSVGAGGFSPLNNPPTKAGFGPGSGKDSLAWPLLMEKLVTVLTGFAAQQVQAGADVIQIFDSWAGALSVADYRQYCLGPTTQLIRQVQALGVPVIYFGVDTASLLPTMRETGADVIGLDWRVPLDVGWNSIGHTRAVQGNLDPITLFAPPAVLHARVKEVLDAAAGRPGHIFNLGHGIVPGTPVENVIQVVQWVKSYQPTQTSRLTPTL